MYDSTQRYCHGRMNRHYYHAQGETGIIFFSCVKIHACTNECFLSRFENSKRCLFFSNSFSSIFELGHIFIFATLEKQTEIRLSFVARKGTAEKFITYGIDMVHHPLAA